jgi:hypothetical protein
MFKYDISYPLMSTKKIEGQQKQEAAEIRRAQSLTPRQKLSPKPLPIPTNLLCGFWIKPFWSQR